MTYLISKFQFSILSGGGAIAVANFTKPKFGIRCRPFKMRGGAHEGIAAHEHSRKCSGRAHEGLAPGRAQVFFGLASKINYVILLSKVIEMGHMNHSCIVLS
eukprot:sb/3478368/